VLFKNYNDTCCTWFRVLNAVTAIRSVLQTQAKACGYRFDHEPLAGKLAMKIITRYYMAEFTHLDAKGTAQMVDVGAKNIQKRYAKARGKIFLAPETLVMIKAKLLKKGDVLTVAQIAGILAAKKTPELIPLCHPLILDKIAVNFKFAKDGIIATAEAYCAGRTGVEMEALTAVSFALLTIYDMSKAIDKNMRIGEINLIEKTKTNI
jgi:cyclic pyranopterin monophosphate synthase